MFRFLSVIILFWSSVFSTFAQTDSTKTLQEIEIKAFETKQSLFVTPASVSKMGYAEIQRYNNAEPLPILNSIPGVRMEERSPSSYRLSLRGSSIRSPYGVRNVKVYWNGIPMSDANGNTYLNQIDFNSLGNIELIKGPASSIYGGGYGGVLSLASILPNPGHHLDNSFGGGSYSTLGGNIRYGFASKKLSIFLSSEARLSEGYREHSSSDKTSFNYHVSYYFNPKHSLSLSVLSSLLDYNTPGGLNLEQMQSNRRMSRPATATLPGAKEQNAGIKQHLELMGITHTWKTRPKAELNTTVYYSKNNLSNPFITNYEERNEKTTGYRIASNFNPIDNLNFVLGSEGIFTKSVFEVFENLLGEKGNRYEQSRLNSKQLSHFVQAKYLLPYRISFTAGLSFNQQEYRLEEIITRIKIKDRPTVPWTPRLAFQKTINNKWSAFYTFSKGYSSPTSEEILSNYQGISLKAEQGINHEIGLRFRPKPNFQTNLSIFNQTVKDALVRSVLENGEVYFENTGRIKQKGLELSNVFTLGKPTNFIREVNLIGNLSLNTFSFDHYVNDNQDLKGKIVPGTSKTNIYLAGRFIQKNGFFLNIDINFLSKIPLNNQNTVYADATWLSTSRLGWAYENKRLQISIYSGVNNIFNQEYSLGYDFNAFGGRFYNPAPKINFNGGANFRLKL